MRPTIGAWEIPGQFQIPPRREHFRVGPASADDSACIDLFLPTTHADADNFIKYETYMNQRRQCINHQLPPTPRSRAEPAPPGPGGPTPAAGGGSHEIFSALGKYQPI